MNELFAPLVGFQSRKAAQVTAYFACSAGGQIEKLKLVKLLYLSDRESMDRRERPMFYDEFYSLKDGPICSAALNGINGLIDPENWDEYTARNGNIVVAVRDISRDDLTEVSDSDFRVIDDVWNRFAKMSASALRNYTHANCPEYREVFSGRSPITYAEVFRALGKENPDELAEEVENFRQYEGALSAQRA